MIATTAKATIALICDALEADGFNCIINEFEQEQNLVCVMIHHQDAERCGMICLANSQSIVLGIVSTAHHHRYRPDDPNFVDALVCDAHKLSLTLRSPTPDPTKNRNDQIQMVMDNLGVLSAILALKADERTNASDPRA